MRPAFVISLAAALGIHAAILLVPRIAATGETTAMPVVTIDLSETPVMAIAAGVPPLPPARPEVARRLPAPSEPAEAPPAVQPAESAEPQPRSASTESAAPEALARTDTADDSAETAVLPRVAGYSPGPAGVPGPAPSAVAAQAGAGDSVSAPMFSAPAPLSPIQPGYPRSARQSGTQGLVKVSATINEDGTVTGVEVSLSSGSALLDRAAVDAVRKATFVPARQDGHAIASRIIVPIRFQLSGATR